MRAWLVLLEWPDWQPLRLEHLALQALRAWPELRRVFLFLRLQGLRV